VNEKELNGVRKAKKGRAKEEKVRIKTILPQIFELNFPFYSFIR
jgi:hypothetical protein